MAFNLYFAGSKQGNDEHILKRKACRLFSYGNDKKDIAEFLQHNERGPLLVDSGAFSVAHSGININIDDYIQYINNHPEIEYFIELDKIPYPVLNNETAKETAEISWNNYLYMIERLDNWEKLLPVYHFGEDIKYFRQMLEFTYKGKHIPYICIGGRHGVSTAAQERYFDKLFTEIKNSSNPNVKVHVLGMTVLKVLEKFPFYSADSTSYLQQAIYGIIMTKFGSINISDKNKKKDNFSYMSEQMQQVIEDYVNEFGYTIDELKSSYLKRILFNIDYCLDWCNNYRYTPYKISSNFLL